MKLPYKLQDVYDGEAQQKFTVISTFAGGGGSSTGYRLAGGKILCINEFVEEARNTYSKNYPSTTILPGDIKELTGKDFLEATGLKQGELDILDGSPPCSAFSVAGSMCRGEGSKHSDGWGKTKTYSDGKKVENIEDLFFEYVRVAKDIQPKVIVAENVKGLTIGEAKSYYAKITNAFEEIGYLVTSKVMKSSHYGVGQARERLIFIAVREDIADKIGLNVLTVSSLFPPTSSKDTTIGDVIDGVVNDPDNVKTLTEHMLKSGIYKTVVHKMPKDPDKILSGMDYHEKGHCFNTKRASFRKPSPTLTASGGLIHWDEDRVLTVPELKRIQSLPDDFILTGSQSQQTERVGRMVPPLMMKAIAENIYKEVLSKL
jgi:DNA (cytosine-5)-methyltransferase 1